MLLQAIFRFPKDRIREALHLGHFIKIYIVVGARVLRGRRWYVVVNILHWDKTLFLESFSSVAHLSPQISSCIPNKPFVKCYPDLLNHSWVETGILGYLLNIIQQLVFDIICQNSLILINDQIFVNLLPINPILIKLFLWLNWQIFLKILFNVYFWYILWLLCNVIYLWHIII